jgi:hypothetical protein
MNVDERQLQITGQQVTEAMRAVDRDVGEPAELWARVERQLDRSAPRRKWFRLTLAAATAVAITAFVVVWRESNRHTVNTDSNVRSITTIEAMCRSLVSMRQDVIPLPDDPTALRFAIERTQAAYEAADDAFDTVARSDLPPPMRPAHDQWQLIFESEALGRINQAADEIDGESATNARQSVGGALTMMVVALDALHGAGIEACDPRH